jgi:hypothetical protein
MKRFLPFLAAGIFALASCSSDNGETSQSSSSSSGGGVTTLSSSSDGATTQSSSSGGAATSSSSSGGGTQFSDLYCYDPDDDDCSKIGSCGWMPDETACTSNIIHNVQWCENNNKQILNCDDNSIGSCIAYESACYESIPKYFCEDEDDVFYPDGICDTSIYSYCSVNCKEINSSFTKSDCINLLEDGMFLMLLIPKAATPKNCLIEPLSGN